MTRVEALVLFVAALVLLTVAAFMLFGAFGLAGAGVVLAGVALFTPTRGEDS